MAIFLLVLLFILPAGAFETEDYEGREVVKGELLLRSPDTETQILLENNGAQKTGYNESLDVEKYRVTVLTETVKLLRESGRQVILQPNYVYRASYLPGEYIDLEDMREAQWGLYEVQAHLAWDVTRGSTDVVVSVVDTGIDYNHQDLSNRMWRDTDGRYGYDFVNGDSDPFDDEGHGTHVAGIIAAEENGSGVVGLAPGVRVMAVKVLDSEGKGTTETVAGGIKYAADQSCSIINLSLGGGGAEIEEEAVNYACDRGVLLVAASGNSNESASKSFPAAYVNVVSVGAMAEDGSRASFSNFGRSLDFVAPGVGILSTVPGGWEELDGTSMAAPFVSGAAALILSVNPALSPFDVRRILVSSCDDVNSSVFSGYDAYLGYGRLNASKAVQSALGSSVPVIGAYAYPNPFSLSGDEAVIITLEEKYWSQGIFIRIYTLSGEMVSEMKGWSGFGVWKPENVAPGLYFYSLSSDVGETRGKILIQK
ncbi:MAG TPA: S8 family peptidase [bacterium]|nr:S8 family peptidase [bacterium]